MDKPQGKTRLLCDVVVKMGLNINTVDLFIELEGK